MVVIWWYCLFALTTALAGIYELVYPAMDQVNLAKPDSNVNVYSKIMYVTFTGMFFLAAPLVLLPCLIPSMGERFRKSLLETLLVD